MTNNSFNFIRKKIYGARFSYVELNQIIFDIVNKNYCDAEISSFLTACAAKGLDEDEILSLTKIMINIGQKITWDNQVIADKHCIGGICGNRTTPIIVAIATAYGLTIPKTSSRAITSPSGTADTMEVLTNVEFDIHQLKHIVAKTNGCLAWGGMSQLSPADDILVRIERILNLDSEGQMVASILSKKIAAGSNHVLIDIPVGKHAKIANVTSANILNKHLCAIGEKLGIEIKVLITDGSQPIGNGIGPALEARDVLAVLKNDETQPQDLRNKALIMAGELLEFSHEVKKGSGKIVAQEILQSGKALEKFLQICQEQGGIKTIPQPKYIKEFISNRSGKIIAINNLHIAAIAKLAGAPLDKTAGVDLFAKTNSEIKLGQKLFAIHSESLEKLEAATNYFNSNQDCFLIE